MEETGVLGENNWPDDIQKLYLASYFFFCRFIPKLSLVALNVWRITEFKIRITQRVSLVGQELPSFPRHQTLTSAFTGGLVAQSSFLCNVVIPCLFLFPFWPLPCLSFVLRTLLVCSNFFFCNCNLVLQLYYLFVLWLL